MKVVAKNFNGYEGLVIENSPRPPETDDRVLVRVRAAGVTPLDHTILFGNYPKAHPPLVLGNEGSGIVEASSDPRVKRGDRVMFTGHYGVSEDGAWQEWIHIRVEDLFPIPDAISDQIAATLPVAYLTAMLTLQQAGFVEGQTVLAPAIGGSVGNATYQLARALKAKHAISTAGSPNKARAAAEYGFENIIDLSSESISAGVARITNGYGSDIIIESVGGSITGDSLHTIATGGRLITLGYSAGRQTSIDVTDLMWKRASMAGFSLFAQTPETKSEAWSVVHPLITGGLVKPILDSVFPISDVVQALKHAIEDRPFGKVVLMIS